MRRVEPAEEARARRHVRRGAELDDARAVAHAVERLEPEVLVRFDLVTNAGGTGAARARDVARAWNRCGRNARRERTRSGETA